MNWKNRWILPAIFSVILLGMVSLHAQVPPNPVPLIDQPLVPTSTAPGGADITLTVNGTGFVSGATVDWNGSALVTAFVNANQVTAIVPAANIATAGTASITVVNPTPGGGTSNVAFFHVTNPTTSVSMSKTDYAVGSNPFSVATQDFNGDGLLDLAVANPGNDTVSILLGIGDGTFQAHPSEPTVATGSNSFSVMTGDFSSDGNLDLAVTNSLDDTVSILLGIGDGTFQAQPTPPATGLFPSFATVGDFNGDGKLDLAVPNQSGNTVSILRGNGDGTFLTQTTVATGLQPRVATAGDFDGDGNLDLAVTNSGDDTVSILLGIGDGTFQAQPTVATGTDPYSVTTADFNADGKLDLAVANSGDNTVSILLGIGDGTFLPQPNPPATGLFPISVITGDFSGDGNLDLAVSNLSGESVSILLGNGDGTFQTQTSFATGGQVAFAMAGDFNGDGRLDLAVANYGSDTVSVLLQTGTPYLSQADSPFFASIQAGTTYLETFEDGLFNTPGVTASAGAPFGPGGITDSVDSDDGAIDGSGSAGWSFFSGSGAAGITFTFNATTLGGFPTQAGIAWTDGSGTTSFEAFDNVGASLGVAGPIAIADGSISGTTAEDHFFGAVNPGGISAIKISNSSGGIEVDHLQYGPFAGASPLTIVPGRADFGSEFGSTTVGNTVGGLNNVITNTATFPVNITSIDVTGDFAIIGPDTNCPVTGGALGAGLSCNLDLEFTPTAAGLRQGIAQIVSDASGSPYVVPLTGIGVAAGGADPVAFIHQPLEPTSKAPGSAAFPLTVRGTGFTPDSLVHWNGNPLELPTFINSRQLIVSVPAVNVETPTTAEVAVDNPAPGGSVRSNIVLFHVTNSTSSVSFNKTNLATGAGPQSVATGDFDGDGNPDLIVGNRNDNNLSIFLGNGTGTFQSPTTYNVTSPRWIAAADFNNDGNTDLAVPSATTDTVAIALGNGNGTFQTSVDYGTGSGPQSVITADFNADGMLDLAIPNFGSAVSILLGNGNGTFLPKMDASVFGIWATTGDFDDNGNLDLATATGSGNSVRVAMGNGDGTFQTPVSYAAGAGTRSVVAGDFNGDGILDLATANVLAPTTVSVFLNNQDGTFGAKSDYTTGASPVIITTGDFNGDNILDLATTNFTGATASVLLGNGNGAFQTNLDFITDASPFALTTNDFNDDGRLDLAVTNNTFNTLSILLQPTPPPAVLLSPGSLEFAGQAVGTTSATKTVTLTNNGSEPLSITSIVITGTNSGDFARTTTCGTSLAAGDSCTISVTFAPTALGAREASVTITDNAGGSPHTVALTGTGLPVLALSETALTMPDTPINLTCVLRTVTLTNTSADPVTISSIATSSAEFIQTNTCLGTLGAGASCVVSVVFHPAAIGLRAGTLTITSSVEGSPQVVTLSGEGLPLCLLQAVVPSLKVVRGTDAATFDVFHDAQGATELAEASIGLACADAAPAQCSFNPQTIAVTGRSRLTVENLRAVGGSSKALKVTGNSAQEKHTMWVQVLFADFSFTKYPNEASVKAGETARYALSIVPVNGLAGRMALKCTGVPVGTSCTVTPGEVTLEGGPVQVAVKVGTTQRGGIVRPPTDMAPRFPAPDSRLPIMLWSVLALLMAAVAAVYDRRRSGRRGTAILAAISLLVVMTWGSCGGGGGVGPMGWQGGTPLGTHTLVIQGTVATPGAGVATDANTPPLTHETQITLKVK